MELIHKYFQKLTDLQRSQFEALEPLYKDWIAKINVISRIDIDNIYEHHVLHSLAIAKEFHFVDGSRLLDFGCGGGFPGIPLAIMFPKCHFKLIDGTGKKVMVAREIAQSIGLENVEAAHLRGEEEKGKYDFIVSRAVMPLSDMVKIVRKNISPKMTNARPNGMISLKGGQLAGEIKPLGKHVETISISKYFEEDWFKEKYIVYSY